MKVRDFSNNNRTCLRNSFKDKVRSNSIQESIARSKSVKTAKIFKLIKEKTFMKTPKTSIQTLSNCNKKDKEVINNTIVKLYNDKTITYKDQPKRKRHVKLTSNTDNCINITIEDSIKKL